MCASPLLGLPMLSLIETSPAPDCLIEYEILLSLLLGILLVFSFHFLDFERFLLEILKLMFKLVGFD